MKKTGAEISGDVLERILPNVEKPGRYIGGEYNQIVKEPESVEIRVALAFPDVYEVGMSFLGYRLFYELVNNLAWAEAERIFAPWIDMEKEMRENGVPLFSLENHSPLTDFDLVCFSLQHEMCYTNILNMLDLGGIPIRGEDRDDSSPIVIAGGPCAAVPEPLAPFIDAFVIGEGEEVLIEIMGVIRQARESGLSREDTLKKLSALGGVYIPEFYEVKYQDKKIIGFNPKHDDIPKMIYKRAIDFKNGQYPSAQVVPHIKAVHHRATLEIMRGCTWGCRFCQAGMMDRPVREKDAETLFNEAMETIERTGYEEISLLSLSSADYTQVEQLVSGLIHAGHPTQTSVSFPSLRIDSFKMGLAQEIQKIKRAGLTFAPEAGTERLRTVINKPITDNELLEMCENAYKNGWGLVKLYFMVGLPTETDEDLQGIVDLTWQILKTGLNVSRRNRVAINISPFVSKCHTPFQWSGAVPMEELYRRQGFIKDKLRNRNIEVREHSPKLSLLEGAFARGGRDLAPVVESAWRSGCRFDEWWECFDFDKWVAAFAVNGIDIHEEAERNFEQDEILPWDHINTGVSKEFLLKEYKNSTESLITSDCRRAACYNCGVINYSREGDNVKTDLACDFKPLEAGKLIELAEERTAGNSEKPYGVVQRMFFSFSKTGYIRYIGHLDLMRQMIESLRRSGLPSAYSEGFNPRVRLAFASPLALGVEGLGEVAEVGMYKETDLVEFAKKLNKALPEGLMIVKAAARPAGGPSLTQLISHAGYRIELHGADEEIISKCVDDILSRDEILIDRKGKKGWRKINIRPLIESLEYDGPNLRMVLACSDQGTGKPQEILDLIGNLSGQELESGILIRECQLGQKDGRILPLIDLACQI